MADNLAPASLVQIFQIIVEQMPYGFAYHKIITDQNGKPIDYIFLEVNKKFEEFTGLKKEQVINQKVTVAIPGIEHATPDLISIYGNVALTGEHTELEFYFAPLKRWYNLYVFSPQKEYFIALFADISQKKALEKQREGALRAVRAISECNQAVIHGESENEILQQVCEKIITSAGYKLAWVGYAQNDEEKSVISVAQAGFEEGYLKNIKISWADNEYGRGPTGKSIRTKEVAIMQNMATNPDFAPWREEALKRGYASSMCLPLLIDSTTGSLCIYSSEPDAFNEEEVKLLKEMANDLTYGIIAIRNKKEKENFGKELEQSRNQLQTILTSISDGFFTLNHEFRYTYINDQAAKMVGRNSAKDLLGKLLFDEFPQAKGSSYDRLYHDAMNNKKVLHFEEYYEPLKKWHEGTIYPSADGISIFFQEITERKKIEEEMLKKEKALTEAQRIGKVGSWEWDSTTDTITWSEEYYRIIGLDPKTPPPSYENHLKEYTPESAKRLDEAVKKALQTGEPYELELEQIRPNNTKGWIIARAEVKRDEKNNIVGLRGTALDITAQKNAQEELKRSNAYNRNLIETSLDPMLTVDSMGIISDVNHAFEVATGMPREKIIMQEISQFFTDPIKVKDGLQKTLAEGFIKDYRVSIKNISGKITDCIWNTIVYKNDKEEVQGVFAAARDISQLESTQESLRQVEERYKTYVENSNDVMFALDAKGFIQYLSPQCRRFGLDPETLINKKTFEEVLPEKSRKQVMEEYQKILSSQKQGFITFEYIDSDGHTFWLEASGKVLFDKDEMPIGSIGIMRDITERKLSENRLRELDSIKSRFIRVVSHQLRTPLAAIRWQLESLLSEHDHLTELQKQLIQESHRADLEIINTINDLITALDIEEGREVRLDKTETSFVSLWESVEHEYLDRCKVKKISCSSIKPSGTISLVNIDTEKIRTALGKLADNALVYTKDGGQISVKIDQTADTIHFEITDTGIGIPKEEQKYIFERFYRASNAALMKPDASGLGLYIAKNFIESHGGKIGFTSEEGKGSTFWFELPV